MKELQELDLLTYSTLTKAYFAQNHAMHGS